MHHSPSFYNTTPSTMHHTYPHTYTADFNEGLLSPSHTSEDEFVTELENYTKSHRAVSHHLLANLATASFAKKETADMLLRFLSAYSQFNSGFIANVETLVGLLDNPKHAEILKENLEEEIKEVDGYFGTMELPLLLNRFEVDYKKELIGERVKLHTPSFTIANHLVVVVELHDFGRGSRLWRVVADFVAILLGNRFTTS